MTAASNDFRAILSAPSWEVGPRLLGSLLVYDDGRRRMAGRIVETEAYDQTDAASHGYKGRTPRSEILFGSAGCLYVYFTYGMHHCCNVVTGGMGYGSAVFIRAVEPLEGKELMLENRGGRGGEKNGIGLTNGPAKVCQAYGIDKTYNGHDLRQRPLRLEIREPLAADSIITTTRIGISQAKDVPWRWYIRDNPYVSGSKSRIDCP